LLQVGANVEIGPLDYSRLERGRRSCSKERWGIAILGKVNADAG
jgi:hypothetical protein